MPAIVSAPRTVFPEHRSGLAEVCRTVQEYYAAEREKLQADHDQARATGEPAAVIDELAAAVRKVEIDPRYVNAMEGTGVEHRYFVRDLRDVLTTSDITAELTQTVKALTALAVRAARAALDSTGVEAHQIDCLIVTSVTGYEMPSLDIAVINELGLRRTVRRLPVAQIGCAGTAWALGRAREQIAAYPGSKILVVSSEAFSSCLQPSDCTLDALIFKALGGDGAGAFVVQDADAIPGGGLVLHRSWDDLVPGTGKDYRLYTDELGLHFHSTRKAPKLAGQTMDQFVPWLKEKGFFPPDFAAVHTGGPAIIKAVAAALGLEPHDPMLEPSWQSMSEIGNVGSMGLMNVLERIYANPPADGAKGFVLAFGPGFSGASVITTWVAG